MAAATELENSTERLPAGFVSIRLTTTGTTSTYACPYFDQIVAAVGNNESDKDGVDISWENQVITIKVATSGDVVTLFIAGRY